MKHLGLFEGIGGFSLAARWAGWHTVAWVEINEFGQKVLRHHFPDADGHGDIKTFDGKKYEGKIDIITGGFPCQPFSAAGKRKGTDDERHLWPQMLRVIREVHPSYVVGENVRGFTNWNGGMVFDQVQADLEAEGYEVLPFLLPACAVNAPHRRDRIWIVAHSNNIRGGEQEQPKKQPRRTKAGGPSETTAHAMHDGRSGGDEINADKGRVNALNDLSQNEGERTTPDTDQIRSQSAWQSTGMGWVGPCFNGSRFDKSTWQDFPTQPPVRSRNDGLSPELDGITVSKHRKESIMAYGNAIVPQVAFEIFKVINQL